MHRLPTLALIARLLWIAGLPAAAALGDDPGNQLPSDKPPEAVPPATEAATIAAKPLKVTFSRETTHFTKPLLIDGSVDYAGAINDKLSEGVTPDNNAAVALLRVTGPVSDGKPIPDAVFERLGMERLPKDGPYLISIDAYCKQREIASDSPRYEAVLKFYGNTAPWRREQCPEVAEWLDINAKPLDAVEAAVKRSRYFFPMFVDRELPASSQSLLGATLYGIHAQRELSRALSARALLRLGEGDFDGAWRDIMTGRRLGRLVAQGPMMIHTLVGYAIDIVLTRTAVAYVEHAAPDARRVKTCLEDIDSLPPIAPMVDRIDLGERCMYLDIVQNMARGGDCDDALVTWDDSLRIVQTLRNARFLRINWSQTLKVGNAWYDRVVAAVRIDDRQRRNEVLRAIEDDVKKTRVAVGNPLKLMAGIATSGKPGEESGRILGETLVTLLLPAMKQARNSEDRTRQLDHLLKLALALQAHRSERGAYPTALAELSPRHLRDIPPDLFSGKPLVYKPEANGYLLYSVGLNAIDDGGASHEDVPRTGDDDRIRMPTPKKADD